MIKLLEALRIAGCSAGIFLAYLYGQTPEEVLRIMTPWFIGSIAGLSGIEGLVFGERAAREKGFEVHSNYQRQNAFWFLSIALIALLIYVAAWNVYANIAIVLLFSLFLVMSAANHVWSTIACGNRTWQNMIRPLLTLLLVIAFWYPVTAILFK
ncbi:MAG: hypothetical protein OQK66_06685 [Prosthecochloris sp.]|uniref:DUF6790 family protein n=1 Tax=unclassified Prosthecochloris TaxID=2632826 RepID=UPI000DF77348|nr:MULTISPECIES: DUF6790 family protein [unclassified Prosthecochloris]MCW8798638.1 hypothetical protein [Prosthecochloris sp.]RDD30318.1 hypothetical protein CR161_06110 [Prosthecochloris sp. ZM]